MSKNYLRRLAFSKIPIRLNMCYIDRLVILHHSCMFGNLTTRGEEDHLGMVEEHKIRHQKHLSGKESFPPRNTDKTLSHEKHTSFRITPK